ncbi:MAG: hypothetical protein FWC27_13445 [Firmicutes bacterium]|nr:hypothetical protein [Bacillota bacterium]
MTPREIFTAAMRIPRDQTIRLPRVEWAAWWDKTIRRWEGEGLPSLSWEDSLRYFDLDIMRGLSVEPGAELIRDEAGYERLRPRLFTQKALDRVAREARRLAKAHERGEFTVRFILNGFFWYPRRLFGIEGHLYAFYDHPELMHKINQDLLAFNLEAIERVCAYLRPDLLSLMEDMSYNHGPMLSQACFDEFLRPYYLELAKALKSYGVPFFVDTDGLVDRLVPWLLDCGAEGLLPLERQSGVDVNALRAQYPGLKMLGGFDKMVMDKGEAAMRGEFERLLPLMKAGGFVPSVDHQTPPGVGLEAYRLYVRLLREYTGTYVTGKADTFRAILTTGEPDMEFIPANQIKTFLNNGVASEQLLFPENSESERVTITRTGTSTA